ncbi:hypothetical protein CIPAW_02G184900 [Carya illinoinensis]|uniref:Uncharacterized protein n=1 Tax=Carya illinoinensis TaxID=32201 RepID=A0A8T1RFK1_CARIL|nr:hypothetical protein CIPAW_02G184900 [Carya illinoinensis]
MHITKRKKRRKIKIKREKKDMKGFWGSYDISSVKELEHLSLPVETQYEKKDSHIADTKAFPFRVGRTFHWIHLPQCSENHTQQLQTKKLGKIWTPKEKNFIKKMQRKMLGM